MGRQLLIILAVTAALASVVFGNIGTEDFTVFHVFLGLLALLVVSSAVLWPRAGRDQRAELEMERPGWADRVKIPQNGEFKAQAASGAGRSKHSAKAS